MKHIYKIRKNEVKSNLDNNLKLGFTTADLFVWSHNRTQPRIVWSSIVQLYGLHCCEICFKSCFFFGGGGLIFFSNVISCQDSKKQGTRKITGSHDLLPSHLFEITLWSYMDLSIYSQKSIVRIHIHQVRNSFHMSMPVFFLFMCSTTEKKD